MVPGDCVNTFWDCLVGRLKRARSSSGSGAPGLFLATAVTPQAEMGTSGFLFFGLKASMK